MAARLATGVPGSLKARVFGTGAPMNAAALPGLAAGLEAAPVPGPDRVLGKVPG